MFVVRELIELTNEHKRKLVGVCGVVSLARASRRSSARVDDVVCKLDRVRRRHNVGRLARH